jgi:hypothetical protein
MRRILDALNWLFVVLAVTAAFYFTSNGTDASAGVADHNHRSEAQRNACQTCRYDIGIEDVVEAPAVALTARAF